MSAIRLAKNQRGKAWRAMIDIGPVHLVAIDGEAIPVTEMDYETGQMKLVSPDGRITLDCECSDIAVTVSACCMMM